MLLRFRLFVSAALQVASRWAVMEIFLYNRHLVVSSSATESTAYCLHSLGFEGEPLYHAVLNHLGVALVPAYSAASHGILSISAAKKLAVELALAETDGNKTWAAQRLGCTVRTVRNLVNDR